MPGKKVGKVKLARMTEEERFAYEEQKRLAEEEMKKKKEDLLSQFLKDKLLKEEKSTRFNLNKLNHQWRNIMREAKARELKKDIEILSQTFERVIDRKDAVIKSLSRDLSEAEEQYAMAFRSHLQNIDYLIDLQKQRLRGLEHDLQEELEIIREEFDSERTMLLEQHTKEMNDMADIFFALEYQYLESENEAKSEFQSNRDEIKNKNLEEKHSLRVQLEAKVDDLWQQFRTALHNYNETTEERKIAFEALKLKDEKSAREIELQMRKLQRISDQIAHLKQKMAVNVRDCEERNRQLRDEREGMLNHFQELKAQMNTIRDDEREKLTKLTLESRAAIKECTRQKEKGKMILKLAEMCRKLETEEEKVLPFYVSSLTKEEQEDVNAAVLEPPVEPLAAVMHQYTALENFWKRYNKVLLEKLALEKEKQMQQGENGQLRFLLKQYLDGISVNDEILSHYNPLLVVNSKSNVVLKGGPGGDSRPRPKVFLEAATIVQNVLP